MAGYDGLSMSINAREAYAEGRKPVSSITKEDIQKHGVTESIAFFRWYVKKCCRSCEWQHTSYKYNITDFYDIAECCEKFKKTDKDKLKAVYKQELVEKKAQQNANSDDTPYYAKVEYSISTMSGRKDLDAYAIVHRCWAYIKDDYRKKIIRKKIDGRHFWIVEKFECRPAEMPEETTDAAIEELKLKNPKIIFRANEK